MESYPDPHTGLPYRRDEDAPDIARLARRMTAEIMAEFDLVRGVVVIGES